MRSLAFLTVALGPMACWGQGVSETARSVYTYDGSGRRQAAYDVTATKGKGGASQSQTIVDANGRRVQLESLEETVLSEGPEGRVIERLVKKYDSQGRVTGQEKVRLEESKTADGGMTVRATVFDKDLNGQFALRERTTTTTTISGATTQAQTAVERPNVNGGLELAERKVAVTTGDESKSVKDVTVYRKDQQGAFSPAVREVTETVKEGGKVVANTSEFNTVSSGRMELAGQKVSQTVKNSDGSETQVVDVFGANNPGQVSSGYNREPKLRERQLIERTPGPDKSLVETFSVQRPSIDGGRLGSAQKISETVCSGSCRP